jgi:DNA-binding CsgD family transcriptional regulator
MPLTDAEGERLLEFVGELYEAATEPKCWQALAPKLAGLFDSQSCMLLAADVVGNGGKILGITDNVGGRFLDDYESYYYREDQWLAGALRQPGRAVLGHQLASENWYRSSTFLNELCVTAEVHDLVGATVPLGGTVSGVVGIHRSRTAPEFGERDIDRLNVLLPHIKRAMQITLRLSGARIDYQAALDGLERTGTALIVVDRNATILSANSLAEMLLRRGGSLKSVNGRLTVVNRRVADRLMCLIRSATGAMAVTGGPGGAVALEREEGKLPITVLVTPFRPKPTGFQTGLPAALIFVRDPETPVIATDILRDLFGLTRAQAAVAAQIAEGRDPEQIATALHITLHTVRDHLKVIFAKTGTSRQSQLVALLAPTVAGLRTTAPDAFPQARNA